jgi:hypothetical protein
MALDVETKPRRLNVVRKVSRQTVRGLGDVWSLEETEAFASAHRQGMSLAPLCLRYGRTHSAALKRMQYVGVIRLTKSLVPRNRFPRSVAPVSAYATELATRPDEPSPTGAEGGCQWPHGAPSDRLFCGAVRVDAAWCAHHRARVFAGRAAAP